MLPKPPTGDDRPRVPHFDTVEDIQRFRSAKTGELMDINNNVMRIYREFANMADEVADACETMRRVAMDIGESAMVAARQHAEITGMAISQEFGLYEVEIREEEDDDDEDIDGDDDCEA